MFRNGKRFSVFFLVGAVILVVGLVIQLYPSSIIGGLKERQKEPDVTTDESYKLIGALASWNIWQITFYQPLSSLLFAVGIIIMVYAVISGIFSVASGYKVVKKQETE